MQPILTTTYLLAFPSVLARLLFEIHPCYDMMAKAIFFNVIDMNFSRGDKDSVSYVKK